MKLAALLRESTLFNGLHQRFNGISSTQQLLVFAALLLVLGALLFFKLIAPLYASRAQAQQRLPQLERQYVLMQSQAAEIEGLRKSSPPISATSPINIPAAQAKQALSVAAITAQFGASLAKLEDTLCDGRAFVGGAAPGYADLALYLDVWFQKRFAPEPAVLVPFPLINTWTARVAEIGYGTFTEISGADAISIANAAAPVIVEDVDGASGFAIGQAVTVRTEDPGADPVAGKLVRLTHRDIAVERSDPQVGTVCVHFPRLGQIIAPA